MSGARERGGEARKGICTGFVEDDKMTSEGTWEEAAARCTVFPGRFVWAGGSQSSSSSPH